MAMTDIQTYTLRYDQSLINRVAVEISKAAQFVIAQGPGSPPTALYDNARRAMASPVDETTKFMWFVVTDGTVQANGSDPNATTDQQLAQIIATHYPIVWGGQ
jgi:hypothetical protein